MSKRSAIHGESGYRRVAHDFYETPEWCTLALLDNHQFPKSEVVFEPACGKGAISEVLRRQGFKVFSQDLVEYGYEYGMAGYDFLEEVADVKGTIITNPPYKLAKEFVETALRLTKYHQGSFAMLLRNEFDSAKTRRRLFGWCPAFTRKIVLLDRPVWFEEKKPMHTLPGYKKTSPRHNYSWFVWDWSNGGKPPTIRYAHNPEKEKKG
jgi:hypothetical protein